MKTILKNLLSKLSSKKTVKKELENTNFFNTFSDCDFLFGKETEKELHFTIYYKKVSKFYAIDKKENGYSFFTFNMSKPSTVKAKTLEALVKKMRNNFNKHLSHYSNVIDMEVSAKEYGITYVDGKFVPVKLD